MKVHLNPAARQARGSSSGAAAGGSLVLVVWFLGSGRSELVHDQLGLVHILPNTTGMGACLRIGSMLAKKWMEILRKPYFWREARKTGPMTPGSLSNTVAVCCRWLLCCLWPQNCAAEQPPQGINHVPSLFDMDALCLPGRPAHSNLPPASFGGMLPQD